MRTLEVYPTAKCSRFEFEVDLKFINFKIIFAITHYFYGYLLYFSLSTTWLRYDLVEFLLGAFFSLIALNEQRHLKGCFVERLILNLF